MSEVTIAQEALEKATRKMNEAGAAFAETRDEIVKESKDTLDTAIADVRGDLLEEQERAGKAVVDAMVERQNAEFKKQRAEEKEAREAEAEALLERFDKLETSIQVRAASGGGGYVDPAQAKHDEMHRRAMWAYAASGNMGELAIQEYQAAYPATDKRSLTVGTSTDGGFLVPEPTRMELIGHILEIDPVSELAQRAMLVGNSNSYTAPRMTSTGRGSAAKKSPELGTPASAQPKFDSVTRTVHPISVYTPDVSIDLLSDVGNFEEILTGWAGQELGYKINYNYLNGSGNGEAEGILNASGISSITSTNTTASKPSAEDVYALFSALKAPFAHNAVLMMKRSVLYDLATLRAGLTAAGGGTANDAFLLPYSARDGFPEEIGGMKYYTAEGMPASGASAKALLCGDFKAGYWYARKDEIYFVRDHVSTMPNVRFLWRLRDDGVVVRDDAFKLLTLKA